MFTRHYNWTSLFTITIIEPVYVNNRQYNWYIKTYIQLLCGALGDIIWDLLNVIYCIYIKHLTWKPQSVSRLVKDSSTWEEVSEHVLVRSGAILVHLTLCNLLLSRYSEQFLSWWQERSGSSHFHFHSTLGLPRPQPGWPQPQGSPRPFSCTHPELFLRQYLRLRERKASLPLLPGS